MKFHRPDRVADQILRDASEILQREAKDPKLGFVTFSRVEISKDLKYAKIYYTVLGSDKEIRDSKTALSRCRTFIQSKVGKRLGLRNTPELKFIFDSGLDHSFKIDNLLKKFHTEIEQREKDTGKDTEDQSTDQ
ncbi:MAG: 30S ribosome-binding factor RbfA [candidate division Zixibacteria bacterium]|nr:30S ribosome-binding factor RbfA [candidate division Zixibacteria bacterium]